MLQEQSGEKVNAGSFSEISEHSPSTEQSSEQVLMIGEKRTVISVTVEHSLLTLDLFLIAQLDTT